MDGVSKMPVFDKPLTVAELIKQLGKHDPAALVVMECTHYGPDGVKGIFPGYIEENPTHINMRWVPDPIDGYVSAVELMRPKPKR